MSRSGNAYMLIYERVCFYNMQVLRQLLDDLIVIKVVYTSKGRRTRNG